MGDAIFTFKITTTMFAETVSTNYSAWFSCESRSYTLQMCLKTHVGSKCCHISLQIMS